MVKVSVIIVNYDGKHLLKKCLDALYMTAFKDFEVIVVDNGSTDGSIEFLKRYYAKVRVFDVPENNYCLANNIGAKNAYGKFIAFLNNDAIVDKDWMKEPIAILEKKKCFGVQCKVLLPNGKIDALGMMDFSNFYFDKFAHGEEDKEYGIDIVDVPYGAAIFYDKTKFIGIGMLDPDFQMVYDEVELSYRIKKGGDNIYFANSSIVHHEPHTTFKKKDISLSDLAERNRLYYVAKFYPAQLTDAISSSRYISSCEKMSYIISISPTVFQKLLKHHPGSTQLITGFLEYLPRLFQYYKKIYLKEYETSQELMKDRLLIFEERAEYLKESLIKLTEAEKALSCELSFCKDNLREKENEYKDNLRQKEDISAGFKDEAARWEHSWGIISEENLKLKQSLADKEEEIKGLKRRLDFIFASPVYKHIINPFYKLKKKLF